MKKLNEEKIIRIFQSKFGNRDFVSEDVEFFTLQKTPIAFNIDSMVESADIPQGFKLEKIARKSIIACASDFAAKGVQPKYGFVSVIIPEKYSKKEITQMARGFGKASKEIGCEILGGDTSKGVELALNVCLIGTPGVMVKRKGARINDAIFVTGPFGYTAAGLKILLYGKKSKKSFKVKAKNAFFNPKSRLNFGIAIKDKITSSMDSSDGLSATLNEMAKQSNKKFVIDKIPAGSGVSDFAKLNNIKAMDLIFNGGEEFEFAFTVSAKNKQKIIQIARKLKIPIIEIGRVKSGKKVRFESDGKSFVIKDRGWQHFT